MAAANLFVDRKIAQRKVLLFTKSYCPESMRVRDILEEFNMPAQTFEVVEIEKRQDCCQIENYFQVLCLTDSRGLPRLFVNGEYIGGEKEIPRMQESGKLKELLKEVEAL